MFYYFTDHLGTSREIVQAGQTLPCYDADFYPFGRESTVYTNTCPQNYKFTGKERDGESGLDEFGARYYSSQYVRFMTPDSTAYTKPINPQSWNLYAYAWNNPLSYSDPTGHEVSLANCQDKGRCVEVLAKAAQLPKGVTAGVNKKGLLELSGDLKNIKGGNAQRLLQLVQSTETVQFWIGDKYTNTSGQSSDVAGGFSGTRDEGYSTYFSVVQSDPSKIDSLDLNGVFLNADGTVSPGKIPGANIEETAAHELLGHVWGELIAGQNAYSLGNAREAIIAEDRVRATDPARGLKVSHQGSRQLITPSDLPTIRNPQ